MSDTVEKVRTAQEIYDAAIEALPKTWSWFYGSADDGLSDEQVNQILSTENGYNEVAIEVEDYNWESRANEIDELVARVVPDDDERETLEADGTLWERLKETISERDDTDVVKELARHQHMFVRYHLGTGAGDYIDLAPNSWNWSAGEIYRAARHLCALAKLPWAEHGDKFRELVINATYGGELFVFWYADIGELIEAANHHFEDPSVKRKITWTNPTFLLLDYYNGSGHEFRFDGEYSRSFEYERLSVDGSFGYSWDQVCGLVARPYMIDCKIEKSV